MSRSFLVLFFYSIPRLIYDDYFREYLFDGKKIILQLGQRLPNVEVEEFGFSEGRLSLISIDQDFKLIVL
jgi:hypothetical protein